MRRSHLAVALALTAAAVVAGSGLAARAAGEPNAFAQIQERSLARVAFFGEKGLAGQYSIQYGKPEWKAAYDADFDKMTLGKRIRLGKDWWTTLETYCPLTLGGTGELAEGSWFLALERSEKGDWSLVALDPAPIRKARMDAFSTAKTTGGTLAPMQYEKVAEDQANLLIQFHADKAKPGEQTLEIRFGKHRLTTKVVAKLGG